MHGDAVKTEGRRIPARSARRSSRSPAEIDSSIPRNILLIEDSLALASLMKARLTTVGGANVTHCQTLKEADELIASQQFVFAITGLSLPDAKGDDILQHLENAGLPAMVFTAKQDSHAQSHYVELRLLDYVVKEDLSSVDRVSMAAARILDNILIKVLVVDDTRSARTPIVDALRRQNFTVLEAKSGGEALELLEEHTDIELLITDYHMPDMDGYQLVRKVRQSLPSDQLRIIGVTSSTDRLLSSLFLKAGASDFVHRPILPEEFQCRIDNNVETLKQIKRLRYFAERDQLTDLPNRRYFFEAATKLMNEDTEKGIESAFALLDIDHFKKINDTHGHEAGDETLRTLARCMENLIARTPHLIGRLGGEEFAIYMHGLSKQEAHDWCDTMRAEIAEMTIKTRETTLKITASIGVADVQPHEPLDNQLNAADQLLYMAKNSGRNRVFSEMSFVS
ncbi:GGDEF domain-containing response regulator [Rhizobium halophytocola]|uniref:GGDEF domain-containing response regulator n=1 Tax=Rhizobium halophytocola TaxID=735519 RepID=UPI001FD7847D|nr:diguanylate cyclase [Rhizobium halophytocola]